MVATVNPDGAPHSSVVWAMRDGDTLLFVTARHRPKDRNLANNPRVSVSPYDHDNPYRAVEIRGTADLIDMDPVELLRELALKYTGERMPPPDSPGDERVAVRVTPDKVIAFNG